MWPSLIWSPICLWFKCLNWLGSIVYIYTSLYSPQYCPLSGVPSARRRTERSVTGRTVSIGFGARAFWAGFVIVPFGPLSLDWRFCCWGTGVVCGLCCLVAGGWSASKLRPNAVWLGLVTLWLLTWICFFFAQKELWYGRYWVEAMAVFWLLWMGGSPWVGNKSPLLLGLILVDYYFSRILWKPRWGFVDILWHFMWASRRIVRMSTERVSGSCRTTMGFCLHSCRIYLVSCWTSLMKGFQAFLLARTVAVAACFAASLIDLFSFSA